MNKKLIPLFILSPLVLSACSFDMHGDFVPLSNSESSSSTVSSEEHSEVSFSITEAEFVTAEGHLKVFYTCNYPSPFEVYGHEFLKLSIFGNIAKEIDHSHQGYFTCLSPFIDTTLKFEFIDSANKTYISVKYEEVLPYDDSKEHDPIIDYPEGYDSLLWSDEFDGTSLSSSNWTHEIGNGDWGWGNNELEYYTDRNDKVENGYLTISAKKEKVSNFDYTSTRIKTQNKVKFTYGYVEARIALPAGTGMWPAFWMMPNDSTYGGWPHSGEIDIMEARGRQTDRSSSAIHYSLLNGGHTYKDEVKVGHNITEFHKYAVEWTRDQIRFFVDDYCYQSLYKTVWSTQGAPDSQTAPFDKDFYIILNLAVGGNFDGGLAPDSSFVSADMKVDYVRVFKK